MCDIAELLDMKNVLKCKLCVQLRKMEQNKNDKLGAAKYVFEEENGMYLPVSSESVFCISKTSKVHSTHLVEMISCHKKRKCVVCFSLEIHISILKWRYFLSDFNINILANLIHVVLNISIFIILMTFQNNIIITYE